MKNRLEEVIFSAFGNLPADLKNSDYTEESETECVKVIKRIIASDSGSVFHIKTYAKTDCNLQFENNEPILRITFSLDNPIIYSLKASHHNKKILTDTYNVFYLSESGSTWYLNSGYSYEAIELIFSKSQIQSVISKYADHLTYLKQIINVNCNRDIYDNSLHINYELQGLLKDLLNYNEKKNWEKLTLESTVLRIIMLTLDNAVTTKSLAKSVKEVLESNISHIPKINELCRIFGVNEKMLQQKFRQEYGSSVYDHAHSLKMKKAKQELLYGKSLKEVCYITGYQNTTHFCRAFKKYWGLTTKEIAGLP